MRTPETETRAPGVGAAVKEVTEHARSLVKLELELATLELKSKAGAFGKGIGFLLGAAVAGLFALGFLLATIAAALGTFLPGWLALLIVALALLAVVALMGVLGMKAIKRGSPPIPRQAIREAKQTTEALKANGA
ncbi:MAG: phage holin family protein [Gaiellaceae bacterium]